MRIVVVDDEPSILGVYRSLLKAEGYSVTSFGKGQEAIDAIASDHPDLVISDIRMTPVDGMEVLRAGKERSPDTEFIMCTAFASVETAISALRLNAFDYVTKPFRVDDLLATIARVADYRKAKTHGHGPPDMAGKVVGDASPETTTAESDFGRRAALKAFLRAKEKEYIQQAIAHAGGDKGKAAAALKMSLAELYRKLPPGDAASAAGSAADDRRQPVVAGAGLSADGVKEKRPDSTMPPRAGRFVARIKSLFQGLFRPADKRAASGSASETGADRDTVYPFLVGGLIHDSLNTISFLNGHIELFERRQSQPADGAVAKTFRRIKSDTERLQKVLLLIQSISREYYKKDPAEVARPEERIQGIVEHYREAYSTIAFECTVDPACDRTGLPVGAISFLAGELLENATRACRETANARVNLKVSRSDDGRILSMECMDSGPGIPADILDRIHDGQIRAPKSPGMGGYGFYLMTQLVHRLKGGSVLASNLEPSGARVELLLPFEGGVE